MAMQRNKFFIGNLDNFFHIFRHLLRVTLALHFGNHLGILLLHLNVNLLHLADLFHFLILNLVCRWRRVLKILRPNHLCFIEQGIFDNVRSTSIDSSGMDSFELCDAVDIFLRKTISEI